MTSNKGAKALPRRTAKATASEYEPKALKKTIRKATNIANRILPLEVPAFVTGSVIMYMPPSIVPPNNNPSLTDMKLPGYK